MRTLSLSVLDLVQNSVRSGATAVKICLTKDVLCGQLAISVKDNGCGMGDEELARVTDPFFTTDVTHKVGLGVPLFIQRAKMTDGSYKIKSEKGSGTEISATFNTDSVNFVPLGDMTEALVCMVITAPDVSFHYKYQCDSYCFELEVDELFEALSLDKNSPPFIKAVLIKEYLASKIIQ